jgi:hypothetical protein
MIGGKPAAMGFAAFLAICGVTIASYSPPSFGAEVGTQGQTLPVTPALIREIQFMLSRLGMDPGPIDGVVGPQTNKAIHEFEQHAGLPLADLVNVGAIPESLLTQLRSQASRAILGNEPKPQPAPSPAAIAAPPANAPATAPAPAQPPPDRFAACSYNPDDFRIGATQYTPDKFLQVGFDGSTARAVSSLKDRLDEARQLAENIGGSALLEVQRQARVLNYFSCRLKIEEADATKKPPS